MADKITDFVITIGREYGSYGNEIGKALAEKLNIPFYDKELLKMAAQESGISEELFLQADEKPINSLLYSIVAHGFPAYAGANQYNSYLTNDKLFNIQAEVVRNVAEKPCVIVGRCADDILANSDKKFISVFIYASKQDRIKKIAEEYKVSEKEANDMIKKVDKSRASYYEFYTNKIWGDSVNYDLCFNSRIGIERSVALITDYLILMQK